MSVNGIVEWQQQNNAILFAMLPMAGFMFFFASTAELNRTPMDISEAESEIVAGYHTEYSGMRFGLFYAVELANTLAISGFVATFFLGGWWLWGLDEWVPSWIVLLTKTAMVYFLFVWMRGTLPRFRIDQLMGFCWRFLVPAGLLFVVVAAVERTLLIEENWNTNIAYPVYALINIGLTVTVVGFYALRSGSAVQRTAVHANHGARAVGGRAGQLESSPRAPQYTASEAATSRVERGY